MNSALGLRSEDGEKPESNDLKKDHCDGMEPEVGFGI